MLTVDLFVARRRELASGHVVGATISSVRSIDDLSATVDDFADSVRVGAPTRAPELVVALLTARDRAVEAIDDFEQYVPTEARAPWRELEERLLALEQTFHLDPSSEPPRAAVLTREAATLENDLRVARDVVEQRGTHALEAIVRRRTVEGILEALVLTLSGLASVILFVAWTRQEAGARKRDEEVEAQLRRAIEDLDGFAVRVAHDLRGPLMPLLAESTWLERAPVPDTIRSHGERIARSVRRLSGMIDALLRFARAGAVNASPGRTPLNDTIAEVVEELEETARARGARVETQLGPEAEVRCDANLLRSVVGNLIENALKYGADLRQRAFEPMFRGQRGGHGVGLGLAIVKRLVEGHDGRIEVLTGAEGGALFRIVLPLAGERTSAGPRIPMGAEPRPT